ncbi:hypothetical protein [Polaribacter aquimarinus]|uniref:Lipoprotein n=1 Tax=Polaribacter aquimarinus TaxID=2100726 RepID=A0A2U2J6S1_9FLAO|nr:hypothetical protein [Polaribacter aquimarinus]PWG04043.1 hypothetical protein DIS07_14730 [Polaribacter aquimarinus]
MKNLIKITLIFLILLSCKNEKTSQKVIVKEQNYVLEPSEIGKHAFKTLTHSTYIHCFNSPDFKWDKTYKRFCSISELRNVGNNSNLSNEQRNKYTNISKTKYLDGLKKNINKVYSRVSDYCGDRLEIIDFTYTRNQQNGMTFIDGILEIENEANKTHKIKTTSIFVNNKYKLISIEL